MAEVNALTEDQKKYYEDEGYFMLFKYSIADPKTGEIIEEGWRMKLKEDENSLF